MKNNTITLDGLNSVLDELMIKNFHNLSNVQSKLTGMQIFDMKISDFRRTNTIPDKAGKKSYHPTRFINYVPYSFISNIRRRLYRDSEFFNKYIDFEQIAQNPQIFTHNYMLFIDGEFIRTTEIHIDEHRLGVLIDVYSANNRDGIPVPVFEDYKERDVNVRLVIVPNYTYSLVATNRANILQKSFEIPIERFTNRDKISENSMLFMSTRAEDNTILSLIPHEQTENGIRIEVDPRMLHRNVQFIMIHPNHKLMKTIHVTGEDPFFTLDTTMPVPVNQLNIFKRVYHRGWYNVDVNVDIWFYYPNIYKVVGIEPLDEVDIQVYYTEYDDDQYYNELELFYRFKSNVLDMYKNNTIPDLIKNYKPCHLVYDIADCNKMNMPNDILGYKLGKIKYLLDNDSMYLYNYIIACLENVNNYIVKCESINLNDRLRIDTQKELIHNPKNMRFNDWHYVFGFNYHVLDVQKNSIRLFIDGEYLHESYYQFYGTDLASYIYIPIKYIKPNSVIEVERYWDYIYTSEVIPLSADHKIKTTINHPDCRIKNIFVINENEYYLPDTAYKIYMNGEEYPNDSNMKVSGEISISILDEQYFNNKLKVMVMNDCDADIFKEDRVAVSQVNSVETISHNRSSNYRIFKNGLLQLEKTYDVYTPDRRRREADIIIKNRNNVGDEIVIDYNPCDYKVKYQLDYIEDPKGFVSIPYGEIDKPVSLRWFDIYLNGRKLNKTNIEFISPTKFYLQNVSSRKNLVIIERDRDNELISMGPNNSESINDLIMALPGFKEDVDETMDDIHDILPDIVGDILDSITIDKIKFVTLCLKYTFIQPDLDQITDEIIEKYDTIIEEGTPFNFHGEVRYGDGETPEEDEPIAIRIDCNDIASAPNDVGDKTIEEVGGMAERFAVGPLSFDNNEIALDGEILVDPSSGDYAVCTSEGVVSQTRNTRLNSIVQKVKEACVRDGIVKGSIACLEPEDSSYPQIVLDNSNLLDVDLALATEKVMFYIDVDILTADKRMLKAVETSTTVSMKYSKGSVEETIELPLDVFNNTIHTFEEGTTINELMIKNPEETEGLFYLVHTILMTVQ